MPFYTSKLFLPSRLLFQTQSMWSLDSFKARASEEQLIPVLGAETVHFANSCITSSDKR